MEETQTQDGIVIKTGDGTFFVRKELLDLCRVEEDELETVRMMLDEAQDSDDVSGFSLNTIQPVSYSVASFGVSSISVQPNIYDGNTLQDRLRGGKLSTLMCCW